MTALDNTRTDRLYRETLQKLVEAVSQSEADPNKANDPHNHAGRMAYLFLWRMLNSARLLLAMAPLHDTSLIARSMLEGLINMLYANIDLDTRAKQWLDFIHVHSWELTKKQLEQGKPGADKEHEKSEKKVRESGFYNLWIRPKKNTSVKTGDGLRTANNWRNKDLKPTFEEVLTYIRARTQGKHGVEPIPIELWYDQMYGQLSDWEHWDVAGMNRAIEAENGTFPPQPHNKSIGALVIAINALCEVAVIADKVLSLGIDGKIDQAMVEFREHAKKRP